LFFFFKQGGDDARANLKLLDGDKIIALFANYLGDLLATAGLADAVSSASASALVTFIFGLFCVAP
jgi:hypothetical protein